MKFSARVESSENRHEVTLTSGGRSHSIEIAPQPSGFGSSANGAELLFLALATCYCNDIYREAAKREIQVERVSVDIEGELQAEGAPPGTVSYHATVAARAGESEIGDLMRHTDRVAEIHNALRTGTPVTLRDGKALSL